MESYRKDLANVVVLCENKKCNSPIIIEKQSEAIVKEGRYISCRQCRCITIITRELEDYVKQTRCHS